MYSGLAVRTLLRLIVHHLRTRTGLTKFVEHYQVYSKLNQCTHSGSLIMRASVEQRSPSSTLGLT